jgi:hypothetical protein
MRGILIAYSFFAPSNFLGFGTMRVFWASGVVALIFMGIGNVHSADREVDTETRCVFDLVVNQDEKLRFFKEAKAFAEEHSLFFLEKKLPWFVWEKQRQL